MRAIRFISWSADLALEEFRRVGLERAGSRAGHCWAFGIELGAHLHAPAFQNLYRCVGGKSLFALDTSELHAGREAPAISEDTLSEATSTAHAEPPCLGFLGDVRSR